ncbi:LuxR family maltose regulon positive regulatory protein [Microbacterium phyllosphaerae]|uniref:LuxR family maltose regulon positive regulatory protein n=1 Tax=Microbacterium phyllosphaerae TaxID=124798 RepID=A0ABS4WPH4_9MICO|nr:LuxR C-terminal-related transcriptional regulator [Microbacterium phyllosphaerae]MBP2378103.1 LuxR family maltose regulon positive regulatory protein [Microbacterium phyllosphaerae]
MTAIPPPPAHAVERPRLRSRLDAALTAPLSVIVAPAGSGKTVLLSQWVAAHPELDFIWMSLEPADNDPRRFIDHLLAGVPRGAREVLDLGRPHALSDRALGRPVLDALVTVFRELPPVILVIDDLHALSGSQLLADLWWLADNLPDHTHLVLSSRVDFGLAWSDHRLRHSLLELRQTDLAFDEETSALLLERVAGAPVSSGTLAAVMERTEGWAAGVLLTGLGLRSQPDPELFARQLRGTDRLIAEYLSERALAQQEPARRDLLIRLSVLDRMCADLVESTMGVDDATALFDELERESLFLVALDRDREWFRFHPLFRELLRFRLRAQPGGRSTAILTAAAEWHLAHDDAPAAIDYLLEAHSWDRAVMVIAARGRDVVERSDTLTVSRWLESLPPEFRSTRPEVEILRGMLMMMNGDAARAEDVLRREADRTTSTPAETVVVQTYLAARVQFRPEPGVALRAAKAATDLLRQHPDLQPVELLGLTHPHLLRTAALTSGGRAHFLAGDLTAARDWFEQALDDPGAQYSLYRIHLLGALALLEVWCGRLGAASLASDEALALATDARLLSHPAPADAYLAAALVSIEHGSPSQAAVNIHEGELRAAANHRTQLMWIAHLARILDTSDPAMAEGRPTSTPPPLVADALEAALTRARRLERSSPHPIGYAFGHAVQRTWSPIAFEAVATALTEHRPDLARAQLDAAASERSETMPRATVEQLILRAWLETNQHDRDAGSAALVSALDLASRHGLVATFVRGGPEVIRMVADLPGAPSTFRTLVLERASLLRHARATSPELVEQLTDRELEILAYLPTRMTNVELAARCYVSPNTIKTHMAHIYRKLAVPNRNSAVARAQDLGLL